MVAPRASTWRGALALASLAAACTSDATTLVAPRIVTPAAGEPGAVLDDLDELVLAVAVAGDGDDLAAATFARGEALELTSVPPQDGLVVHLRGNVNDAIVGYGRTCALDASAGGAAPAPLLFFSRTVQWARQEPPPVSDRRGGVAITDATGAAVLLGGRDAAGAVVTAIERFDPRRGETATLGEVRARDGGTVLPLPDGRVAIFGGTAGDVPLEVLELVDPLAPTAAAVDALDDPRLARTGAAATTLSDGALIVVGGEVEGAPAADVIELRLDGGTLGLRTIGASLATARRGATATRLSDDLGAAVLVAGGDDAGGVVAVAELYKPLREGFADPAAFAPTMVTPRTGHRAVLLADGSVLFVGGIDAAGAVVRTLETFSLDAGFVDVGTLPDGAGVVDASLTPLPDGRLLIAGGRRELDGPAVDDAFIVRVDPVDGSLDVVATAPLTTPRAGHQATPLCDGTILLVGGAAPGTSAERYQPTAAGRR